MIKTDQPFFFISHSIDNYSLFWQLRLRKLFTIEKITNVINLAFKMALICRLKSGKKVMLKSDKTIKKRDLFFNTQFKYTFEKYGRKLLSFFHINIFIQHLLEVKGGILF